MDGLLPMRGAQNIPMDDVAEQLAIQRRMKIADALRQQSTNPLDPKMVGSQLVAASPLQHIARALAGWQATRADADTMNMASQYAAAKKQRIAQALAGIDTSKPGGLYQAGLGILNDNPQLAGQLITGGIGNDRMQAGFQHQDQTQERLFGQQNKMMQEREAQTEKDRQAQREFMAEQSRLGRENSLTIAGMRANNGGAGPMNVQEYEYYAKLPPEKQQEYLRVKRAEQIMNLGDRQVVLDKTDPTRSAAEFNKGLPPEKQPQNVQAAAAARFSGEANAKREFNMAGLGDIINEADALFKGKGGENGAQSDLPTESGLGVLWNAGSALVGHTPSGAPEADRLRTIGGALVAKMPRMEGPQSDRDVQNYKEMAGEVGNAGLPIARRQAALMEVRRLWKKYEKAGGGAPVADHSNMSNEDLKRELGL